MPKRLYMDNSSFRDILARFLEENSTDSPLKNGAESTESKTFQPEPTPFLQWENPNLKQIPRDFHSTAYPAPRKIVPPAAANPARQTVAQPKPAEISFEMKQLPPLDQDAARTLLSLGAIELNGHLSSARLKKAHRRLAKALHPDHINAQLSAREKEKRREQFLMLQAAYETLSQALKALEQASVTTSDSESASAPTSRRQDAA